MLREKINMGDLALELGISRERQHYLKERTNEIVLENPDFPQILRKIATLSEATNVEKVMAAFVFGVTASNTEK